ncbi:MAG TPA: hypothetical protein VEA99_06150 [Gemmatimonadaceae bacterium]|nr:hypothetical protein [Gemmatimonadaceae bacterium]
MRPSTNIMPARRAIRLLLLALAASCGDSVAPLPGSGPPDALEFSYGGYGTASVSLQRDGGTIVYTRTEWGGRAPAQVIGSIPSDEQWRAFWRSLDEAGVTRWRREYMAEGIADGMGWHLRIRVNGRTIESQGSNAYPDRQGREHEGDTTAEWNAMANAMLGLVGQRLLVVNGEGGGTRD